MTDKLMCICQLGSRNDFFIAGIIPTIAMILLHSFALAPLVALVGY